MGGDKSVPEKLHENYRNKCDDEEAKTLFDNVNPIRQRGPPRRFISSFANVRNGMMFAMLALFILYDKVEQISRAVNQQMQSNDHYRKISARSHYNATVETSDVVAGRHYSPMSSLAQLQDMIDSTEVVIITMPAKAAGTSLKQFAGQCYGKVWVEDNYLNFIQNKGITGLTSHYELPKVMASHMYTQNSFIHLINNVPNRALMIYSHREETDRLLSAINQVMTAWCRENVDQIPTKQPPGFFSKLDGNNCYVLEKDLIEKAIKLRKREIGISGTRLLTCTVYNTLETNAPNLFFMDYRKAGELMNRLAQKYCPALIDKPVVANTADEKAFGAFVQVESDTGVVTEIPLREWLNVKRGHLELLLGLNNDGTCRAKTRLMEKMLFSSEGGFVSAEDVIKQFHISLKL